MREGPSGDDILGIAEAALHLGVARQTVDTWRHRGVFPEATHRRGPLGRWPAWRRSDLDAWAVGTGRAHRQEAS